MLGTPPKHAATWMRPRNGTWAKTSAGTRRLEQAEEHQAYTAELSEKMSAATEAHGVAVEQLVGDHEAEKAKLHEQMEEEA